MRIKYLNLPKIPDHMLLHKWDDFIGLTNIFHLKDYPFYKQYRVPNEELVTFIQDTLKVKCYPTYQVIKNGIAIHKDHGRLAAVNYLIDTGGPEATLNFYNEDQTLAQSETIEKEIWHWVDVTNLHGVSGVITNRISLSIDVSNEII